MVEEKSLEGEAPKWMNSVVYKNLWLQMGGPPKIGGKPPKWMVYFMENPIKMDDLGGFPKMDGENFMENPIF